MKASFNRWIRMQPFFWKFPFYFPTPLKDGGWTISLGSLFLPCFRVSSDDKWMTNGMVTIETIGVCFNTTRLDTKGLFVILQWCFLDSTPNPCQWGSDRRHTMSPWHSQPIRCIQLKKKKKKKVHSFLFHSLSISLYLITSVRILSCSFFYMSLDFFLRINFLCIQTEIGRPCFLFLQKRVKNL